MRSTPLARTLAGAATGVIADQLFGEPPVAVHPVARFGAAMAWLEPRLWRDSRTRGAAYAAAGLALGVGVGGLGRRSFVGTAAATTVSVAGRELADAARAVAGALSAGDLDHARALLPTLVGRDPTGLDETELARAVVESVAENTVDAIVAPVLWAGLAGASGALGYRAVNTLDAMVGHHTPRYERFGWASARLDDGANFLPARATALAVAACRPHRATAVGRAVRHDAHRHPSPNAGVAEAAFAAALSIRLGGANRYGDRVEYRVQLGSGQSPTVTDIGRAVRLARDVTWMLATVCALGAVAVAVGARSPQSDAGSSPRARR